MIEQEARERIEAVALSWVGTPYHNHGTVKGPNGGVDCAHLLKMVYEEAGIVDDVPIKYYSPQFFLHSPEQRFIEHVKRYATQIDEANVKPGDIVLYHQGLCYAHGAIIVSPGWPISVIHAHSAMRRVMKSGGLEGRLSRAKRKPIFFSRWPG